jgi:Na+-translocating ferredoxin:NAD+ oxidoreductase RnfG subunit
MVKLILIISLFSAGISNAEQPFWEAHHKKVNKELGKWSETFKEVKYKSSIDDREYYNVFDEFGKEMGLLVLSSAKGRFDRFDLMVLIIPNGKIGLIRVLKYRSEYGSEITNKKWLAQFYTPPESEFIFRKNIDAISGATYSSRGITDEINQILKSLTKKELIN